MSTRQEALHQNPLELNARTVINRVGVLAVRVFGQNLLTATGFANTTTTTATIDPAAVKTAEPFIPVYGRFRDDPTWDEYMEHMEQYRREIDAL